MKKEIDLSQGKQLMVDPPQDVLEAATGPCLMVNRFYVLAGTLGIRLIFAEKVFPDSNEKFRTAVNIPLPEAKSFIETFTKVVEQAQQLLPAQPPTSIVQDIASTPAPSTKQLVKTGKK